MSNLERIKLMRKLLTDSLNPTILKIVDDSEAHAGHAGAATGMGHFTITIGSDQFNDKSLLESHKLVYEALGDLMKTDIHALRIIIKK